MMEDSAPEGARISNQDPEEEKSTMVVIKWSDKVEGSVDNIDYPLCGGLYKEEEGYLVPWSGTDPDAKMNCFTWSKEDNDWIVSGDQYNKEFKNWKTYTQWSISFTDPQEETEDRGDMLQVCRLCQV